MIEQYSNVLLSGKIYEYFVGRDEKAISELGAYFTNRLIVDFIFEKIDPTLHKDGTVPTITDIFGGSSDDAERRDRWGQTEPLHVQRRLSSTRLAYGSKVDPDILLFRNFVLFNILLTS